MGRRSEPGSLDRRSFAPQALVANAHVQSILTSGPWRRWKLHGAAGAYRAASRREVVATPGGVHLLGYRNHASAATRGLVILLHGWEGSADSNYLVSLAVALDGAGFDTFRLNFRDHGGSHHLNRELFHSCRLREVLEAVRRLARGYTDGPVFLVGFSLGGNFALRVARQAPAADIPLARVIAVSPVVRPAHVLDALQRGPRVYHHYFVHKWRRSLRLKQLLFPDMYRLDEWFALPDLRAQTRYLVEHFTEFPDLDAYLEGYSVAGEFLEGLEVPSLIITAADDPIIPERDFRALPRPPALELEIHDRGGHCGFLENWRLDAWIDRRITSELCQRTDNHRART